VIKHQAVKGRVTNGGKHLHESGYYVIPCSIKKKTTSKCILININARRFCVRQDQIRLPFTDTITITKHH
jgi:hypothetical protein